MRRYLIIAFSFILFLSCFQISDYKSKDSFVSTHSGFIKDLKENPKGYMVYVDNIVVSNFGEAAGLHLGDNITVSGTFQDVLTLENEGFGNYLKGRGTSYIINSGSIQVNTLAEDTFSLKFSFLSWVDQKLDRLYGEHSFFPKALLYGYTLDKNLLETFRLSGTSHILALSGFHVGFIILFLNLLLLPIGINKRAVIISLLLIVYAYITGGRASIVRSVAFFILCFAAFVRHKRFDTLCAVMIIGCFMMAVNPFVLYDMGFVLSFLCVSSIFMFSPMLNRLFLVFFKNTPKRALGYIYKLALMTIAAQILALPYMVFAFGKIAVASIPANILVLPLVSLLMTLTILSLIFSAFFPFARLLADLGVIIIDVILKINIYIANLSYSNQEFALNSKLALILSLALLGIFIVYEKWRIKENKYDL